MGAHGLIDLGGAGSTIPRAGVVAAAILAGICVALPASAVQPGPDAVSGLRSIVLAADEGRALAKAEDSRALTAEGRLEDALAAAQEALALAKLEFGDGHAYVAFILGDLAEISYRLRDLGAAEDFGTQAVRIIREAMPGSTETAR